MHSAYRSLPWGCTELWHQIDQLKEEEAEDQLDRIREHSQHDLEWIE